MPQNPYKELPLTFEKGLVTEIEDSLLDIGQAADLTNWEPAANGALRCRNAWSAMSKTGLPAAYKVRGMGSIAVAATEIPGSSGATLVQHAYYPDNGGVGLSMSLAGTASGNIIVAVLSGTLTALALSEGGWTQVGTSTDYAGMWYKTSSGGTVSATANPASGIYAGAMYEYSGIASVDVGYSQHATHLTGTSGADSNTINPTSAVGGVVIHVIGNSLTGSSKEWYSSADGTSTPSIGAADAAIVGGNPGFEIRHGTYAGAGTLVAHYSWSRSVNFGWGTSILTLAATSTPGSSNAAEFYIVLAIATSTGYSLYRIPRSQITTGTWELIDAETATDTSGYVAMGQGAGYLVWSATAMPNPRKILLSGPTGSDITDLSGKAGRAVTYHKDRMFVAGDTALASRLYFSGIGTPGTFTTATDYLDIGGDDGESIQQVLSVEGQLLVVKTNRAYLISGSGIENFFVNELPGGTAAPGLPAVRTPYGTILAGTDDIWVIQGGGVDPMSRPLGAGYVITGNASTAYAQDSVLVADSGTGRVWRVNLVTGAWSEENVTAGPNQVGNVFSLNGRLYYGVVNSTSQVGGTRKLSDARSYDFVGNTTFLGATGKVALLGPSMKYTPRYLFLQMRSHDVAHPNELHITITTDQSSYAETITVKELVQREAISIGQNKGVEWIQISFAANASAIAGAIDIERVVLGVDSEAHRTH